MNDHGGHSSKCSQLDICVRTRHYFHAGDFQVAVSSFFIFTAFNKSIQYTSRGMFGIL